jgi:hypothetical protein
LGEKMVIVEPGRPKNTENQRYWHLLPPAVIRSVSQSTNICCL